MANRKIHCRDCMERLGNSWNEVHKYLDGLFDYKTRLINHRVERHHMEGVEYCREHWGDEAAQAAKIHIQRDLDLLDVEDVDLDMIPVNKTEAEAWLQIWINNGFKGDPLGYNQQNPYDSK